MPEWAAAYDRQLLRTRSPPGQYSGSGGSGGSGDNCGAGVAAPAVSELLSTVRLDGYADAFTEYSTLRDLVVSLHT